MAKAIWKFPLQVTDVSEITMPQGAELLTVQTQDGKPCVWALVDPDAAAETRVFITIGTGHKIDGPMPGYRRVYLGTYQIRDLYFVGHVFELVEEEG